MCDEKFYKISRICVSIYSPTAETCSFSSELSRATPRYTGFYIFNSINNVVSISIYSSIYITTCSFSMNGQRSKLDSVYRRCRYKWTPFQQSRISGGHVRILYIGITFCWSIFFQIIFLYTSLYFNFLLCLFIFLLELIRFFLKFFLYILIKLIK